MPLDPLGTVMGEGSGVRVCWKLSPPLLQLGASLLPGSLPGEAQGEVGTIGPPLLVWTSQMGHLVPSHLSKLVDEAPHHLHLCLDYFLGIVW